MGFSHVSFLSKLLSQDGQGSSGVAVASKPQAFEMLVSPRTLASPGFGDIENSPGLILGANANPTIQRF